MNLQYVSPSSAARASRLLNHGHRQDPRVRNQQRRSSSHSYLHPPVTSSLVGSGPRIFRRSRSHLKMLGARWVTWCSTLRTHKYQALLYKILSPGRPSTRKFSYLPSRTKILFNTAFLHALRECSSLMVRPEITPKYSSRKNNGFLYSSDCICEDKKVISR